LNVNYYIIYSFKLTNDYLNIIIYLSLNEIILIFTNMQFYI